VKELLIGADNAAVDLKKAVKSFLDKSSIPYTDVGVEIDSDLTLYPEIAAERVRQAISDKLAVKTESGNIVVTASFGVTSLEDKAETLETLMQKADTALYAAKAAGRNRVCG